MSVTSGIDLKQLEVSNLKPVVQVTVVSSLVTVFTTALWNAFGMYALPWMAPAMMLILSFIGATMLTKECFKNVGWYVFMSLLVFHLARGGTGTLADGEDLIKAASDAGIGPISIISGVLGPTSAYGNNHVEVETREIKAKQIEVVFDKDGNKYVRVKGEEVWYLVLEEKTKGSSRVFTLIRSNPPPPSERQNFQREAFQEQQVQQERATKKRAIPRF